MYQDPKVDDPSWSFPSISEWGFEVFRSRTIPFGYFDLSDN
jgi:hypothetical protein